jgi:hypothetical protein
MLIKFMKILLTIHHNLDPNSGAPGVTWKLGQESQTVRDRIRVVPRYLYKTNCTDYPHPDYANSDNSDRRLRLLL